MDDKWKPGAVTPLYILVLFSIGCSFYSIERAILLILWAILIVLIYIYNWMIHR